MKLIRKNTNCVYVERENGRVMISLTLTSPASLFYSSFSRSLTSTFLFSFESVSTVLRWSVVELDWRRWIRSVLVKIAHYQAEHQRLLRIWSG